MVPSSVAMGRLLVRPAVLFAVDADLRRQSRGLPFEPVVNTLDHPATELAGRFSDANFEVERRRRRRPGREEVEDDRIEGRAALGREIVELAQGGRDLGQGGQGESQAGKVMHRGVRAG